MREFIARLGGSATAASSILWPLVAGAQRAGNLWRIGILEIYSGAHHSTNYAAFVQSMRALGYVEGKDFVTESRFAEGQYERFPDLAAELVRLNVDVLIGGPTPAVRALQR